MNPLLRVLSQLVTQDVARANAGAAALELRRRRREHEDADAFAAAHREPGRIPEQRAAASLR